MAALVQFLAAGVNGAASGTATFVLRGTASSAASVLYNDFEETAQPGTNIITLDANGSAEVYCDAYCDVTLKNSSGSTLRTVTIGNAATTVEVVSDAFTGTSYTGSPTATSQPITLAAVLDKWDDSAGADDWKVSIDGVATNLSTAFASVAGLVFNVKSPAYGALGDGATDDTNAITAAITAAVAAGGGIVYFPPTTSHYRFTTLPISAANITLMGAGPKASLLRSSSTSDSLISFTDNTAGTWKRMIGLGVQGTGANANAIFQYENGQNILVENCDFNCSTFTGPAIRRTSTSGFTIANFNNCNFTLGSSNTHGFQNAANDSQARINIRGCYVSIPASFTGRVISGPDFCAVENTFDASAITSGSYIMVDCSSNTTSGKYLGSFECNTFIDGGSSGSCFVLSGIASGADFHENGNKFEGFTAPTSLTGTAKIYSISHSAADAYKVNLGSRRGRTIEITQSAGGSITATIFADYETVFVNYTAAANININAPVSTMTSGAELFLVLFNNSGAARDIVWEMGASDFSYNATTDGGAPSSNVTKSPNDQETAQSRGYMIHKGSGHPWFVLTTHVEN